MIKAKVWILRKYFDGLPKESDFELKEETLAELRNGGPTGDFLSLDLYMSTLNRMLMKDCDVQIGGQVAKVIQSKNPAFPVGCYVVAPCGWKTHTVTDGKGVFIKDMTQIHPEWPEDIPLSMAVGALGMTGLTALYGVEEVLKVKAGETVFVSAAAGAVGRVAGQICKIKGCKVVGSAGSDKKVTFLKELGFNHAFNYKTVPSLEEALKQASPGGYDCFFENVGGEIFTAVLNQMRHRGRFAVCGATALYSANAPKTCPYPHINILTRRLRIEGFQADKSSEEDQASGKLKAKENISVGFENMPAAFIRMVKAGKSCC